AREREANIVETIGRRCDQLLHDGLRIELLAAKRLAGFQAANALPQRLFERASDRHHFSDALHLRAERRISAGEFLKCPLRDLRDYVIDRGLEARGRLARDVVVDLVEAVADSELRRDLRDREAGRLAGARPRSRDARIHLDDHHAAVRRIDGELNVASAGIDADLPQAGERTVAHHLILAVGERLSGRDSDRIAGVHAHRVEVLDRADDNAVVGEIPHHFELVLLPAERALFHQHFVNGTERDAALQNLDQLFLVVRDAAAGAAEREAGPENVRVADLLRE